MWDHAMSAMSATCMRKGGEHAAVKLMFEISSGRAGSSVHERGICMDHWWPTIPHTRFLENRLSWILQNSRFLKDISISNVNIDVHNMIWTRLSIHDMLKMCTVDVLSKSYQKSFRFIRSVTFHPRPILHLEVPPPTEDSAAGFWWRSIHPTEGVAYELKVE